MCEKLKLQCGRWDGKVPWNSDGDEGDEEERDWVKSLWLT